MLEKKQIKKIQWLLVKNIIKLEEDVKIFKENDNLNSPIAKLILEELEEDKDILLILNEMEDDLIDY